MLVSSISRFNAVNTMNNITAESIQASNTLGNTINNTHTFGGEHDLSMLNKMDNKLGLDLLTNKLLFKMAYLQEKMASKHQQNNEIKKYLNVLA